MMWDRGKVCVAPDAGSVLFFVDRFPVNLMIGSAVKNYLYHNEEPKMRLAEELLACGVAEPVDDFRERLIQRLSEWFPGRSIDGLVCEPTDSLRYCNGIRTEVDSDVLFDAVILKALMNIRKQKSCPTGLSGRLPRRNVKKELQAAGCESEPGAFKELLSDCIADMYKNRTTDEVVCHPREAKALCNYVRSRADCDALSDNFILSTLMNVRKAINT